MHRLQDIYITFPMDIYHFSWILYIVVIAVKCVIMESSNCPTFFNQSDRTDRQINVMEHDLQRCNLFYDIVVILEQLNILIPRNTSCYTLQSVIQSFDKKDPQSDFQTMKITFQFQERFKISLDKTDIEKSSNSMCKKEPLMYNTPFVGKQSINRIQGINESEQVNGTVALPKSSVDNDDSSGKLYYILSKFNVDNDDSSGKLSYILSKSSVDNDDSSGKLYYI